MSKRLFRTFTSPSRQARKTPVHTLRLEEFESRCVPSVSLVKDINEAERGPLFNSPPYEAVMLGDTYFFSNLGSGTGRELWKSDGTPDGTVLVADIYPGYASSSPDSLTVVGNDVYFRAVTETNGYQLWKSDGSAAGTTFVAELGHVSSANLIDHHMAAFGDKLLFTSKTGGDGEELWITDGTAAGIFEVKDLYPGINSSSPRDITSVGSQAYFVTTSDSGTALWRTDGTNAGTFQLQDGNLPINELTAIDNRLFFAIGNSWETQTRSLWTTDGSPAGTVKLRDYGDRPFDRGHGLQNDNLNAFVNFKGSLYFSAYDTVNGYRIWTSDGTTDGTIPVLDFLSGDTEANGNILFAGETKLFIASAEGKYTTTIRVSDGTQAGTSLLEEYTYSSFINRSYPFAINGDSFYYTTESTSAHEFRRTDGTQAGTTLLQFNPPYNLQLMTDVEFKSDGRVFINAANGSVGYDLYIADSLLANPTLLVDYRLATGDSHANVMTRIGDTVYFSASQGLWATDGSTVGTHLIRSFNGYSFHSHPPQVLENQFYFIMWKFPPVGGSYQSELWVSDGTEAGTKLVKTLNLESDTNHPILPAVVGSELYFSAFDGVDVGLWKTNGTEGGTVLVKNIFTSSLADGLNDLTEVNGRVFFSVDRDGSNAGKELWVSDGTEAGTVKLKSFAGEDSLGQFAKVNGILYFAGTDDTGTELWRSDGTEIGTQRVADLRTGSGSSSPSNLTNFNGTLYFTADSESSPNHELWKSDGTAAGTARIVTLKSMDKYGNNHPIGNLAPVGDNLYFTNGTGLWELNSSTGKVRLIEVIPEYFGGVSGTSTTALLTPGNGTIYFHSVHSVDVPHQWSTSFFYDTVTSSFGTWDTSEASYMGGALTGYPVLLGGQLLVTRGEKIFGSELWSFNLPPNVRDDVYTVSPGTPLLITGPGVLANDHDMEGNAMQAVLVGGPGNGTLQLQPGGSFIYTPDAGYVGLDQFTYRATDSENESGIATVKFFVGVPAVPPTISALADLIMLVNSQVVLPFTVGDDVTPTENLTVTFESVNPLQFPNSAITLSGSGANRTLTLSTGSGTGFTTIIVTVTDEYGLSTGTTFNIGVHPSPLPPPPRLMDIFDRIAASSGGNVSIHKSDGAWISSLTPFPNQPGSVRTASGDFNGDGVLDFVFGTGPGGPSQVKVFDGKTMTMLFFLNPFEVSFTGGVNVAAGDVNGDGKAEIVVSPDEGGGPRVRVYNGGNLTPIADFFGIDDPNFRGGARVAIGDMNDDGKGDLVVVAGYGGGPRVAAFDGSKLTSKGGPKLFNDFFAFEQSLRNGIYVATGDVNGDGFADLVAGGGPGGGPRVFILDGKSLVTDGSQSPVPIGNFFAGNPNNRGGIRVAVKDLDGDEKADLVTGAGPGTVTSVAAYYGQDIFLIGTPQMGFSFEAIPGQTSGVFVG